MFSFVWLAMRPPANNCRQICVCLCLLFINTLPQWVGCKLTRPCCFCFAKQEIKRLQLEEYYISKRLWTTFFWNVIGLMSGLTMGLLSLDILSLKVLERGGKPEEKRYAAKILPLVQKHHLLLVTLLLANAAAVEAMPIFMDRISSPVIAICVSVTAVLFFGE